MTQQIIDIGNTANDGQGDPIRTAFTKTNNNFSQLFNATSTSVTGNITGGNLIISGAISAAGSITYAGVEVISPNYISVTGNSQTSSLSTTTGVNILIINNTGYTHTINMPTSPLNGQTTRFATSGNTVTLVVGAGTVTPTFAGSAVVGTTYIYVYRTSNTTWYRSA